MHRASAESQGAAFLGALPASVAGAFQDGRGGCFAPRPPPVESPPLFHYGTRRLGRALGEAKAVCAFRMPLLLTAPKRKDDADDDKRPRCQKPALSPPPRPHAMAPLAAALPALGRALTD